MKWVPVSPEPGTQTLSYRSTNCDSFAAVAAVKPASGSAVAAVLAAAVGVP